MIFTTNGTYTVPTNVFTIMIMVIGAQGGPQSTIQGIDMGVPGLGANITGIMNVNPGEVFNITVGTNGQTAKSGFSAGGVPGGGQGYLNPARDDCSGSGGGGYSSLESNGTIYILAGGGGGSGGLGIAGDGWNPVIVDGTNGGNGGIYAIDFCGFNGQDNSQYSSGGKGGKCDHAGNGGQCDRPGHCNTGTDGVNSFGGNGGSGRIDGCGGYKLCIMCGGGGGGGGGYYGGGGGAGGWYFVPKFIRETWAGSGGGGGSSFVAFNRVKLVSSHLATNGAGASVTIWSI